MPHIPSACATVLMAAVAIGASAPATAQDVTYLTRAEMEQHLAASALCYYPSGRLSCAWAELYVTFNVDHTIMHLASASIDGPMRVSEYRLEWNGNALCVDFDTQGLIAIREAEGYRFPFSLQGLEPASDDAVAAEVAEALETAVPNTCFFYSEDPVTPGQIRQHIFEDGVPRDGFDPVALIPRFASGVAVNPL